MARPFVKQVGGKTRLLPQLLEMLPTGFERMHYCEPFVGGQNAAEMRLPLGYPAKHILHNYDCPIDNQSKVEGTQTHQVRGNSHRVHPDGCHHERKRYHQTGNEGRSEIAKKEEQGSPE